MPFPKCTYNVTMHQRFCSSMNWPELFLLQWSLHHTPAIQILYHDRVPPMVSPANICIFLQELQKQHSKLQLALFFSWLIMANGKNKENEWLKDRTLKCAYSFNVVIWKTSFSCCCKGLGRWQESFLSVGIHQNHDQYGKQHIDNVSWGLR